ncbi:DUF550 domain-containing protein [Citrobacter freundii]|nr:DUF550 domain-containing protein [Citrobacter freundii]ELW9354626.1 DUF550 domain-containing protein [Citrobacter freundii]
MTTDNHPANGPVSLDRLHQISEILSKAAAQSDGGNLGYAMADAVKVFNGVLESMAREQVRREHAAWSLATFGDVGPVGPLKHLSKEALEAAAEPGDLSEWADMQFLLWDAQRRAGISDEQITQAMVEKLAINKQREWPEPKDGEPRLHIKNAGNSPVTPDGLVGCGENCWSCGKYFTYEQHSECDGYCPHCDSPVDLDDEEDEQSKAVPAKPTEDMISNAWRESLGKCDHETIRRMYVAMLAAAPKQEVK